MAIGSLASCETKPPLLSLPSAMRSREGQDIGYVGSECIKLKSESIKL
jgi:hypothetical protein